MTTTSHLRGNGGVDAPHAKITRRMSVVRWPLVAGALVALAGLLLPGYGPLLASTYAELLPGHTHIFAPGPGHAHSYEFAGASADVVALPSADDASGSVVVVVVATAMMLAAAAFPAMAGLLLGAARRTLALARGFITIPDSPPPKTLLPL